MVGWQRASGGVLFAEVRTRSRWLRYMRTRMMTPEETRESLTTGGCFELMFVDGVSQ